MESSDVAAAKKQVKDQKNLLSKLDTKDESFQKMRQLFLKTEEMKEFSQTNRKNMENQFKELQDRLANSSGFLSHIKKSIDNIKFSYQRDILDLEKVTEQSREDMARQIEEIKMNINKLQSRERKPERPKAQTYQEAFNDVLTTFQNIAKGKF